MNVLKNFLSPKSRIKDDGLQVAGKMLKLLKMRFLLEINYLVIFEIINYISAVTLEKFLTDFFTINIKFAILLHHLGFKNFLKTSDS